MASPAAKKALVVACTLAFVIFIGVQLASSQTPETKKLQPKPQEDLQHFQEPLQMLDDYEGPYCVTMDQLSK
jgi:hypothetical protein